MDVTYIFHSGFLIETKECYYLFDYWKGSLPALDTAKPIFVFVSHGHRDHYNPEIFPLLVGTGMERIVAVLANDIPRKRYPKLLTSVSAEELLERYRTGRGGAPQQTRLTDDGAPIAQDPGRQTFLGGIPAITAHHSREYDLPCHTRVQTLLSTDSGVAYLITCPEGRIYHAGDLNEWNTPDTPEKERRQMTGSYRASVNKLKELSIDTAFLPLDPRLGERYADGFLYFLKMVRVRHVYPMHYWEKPETIGQFLREYPQYREKIHSPNPHRRTIR